MLAVALSACATDTSDVDPSILVQLLTDPLQREAAERSLISLEDKAAQPLTNALAQAIKARSAPRQRELLRLLRMLGPAGGAVVPQLVQMSPRLASGTEAELLAALSELAPYRPAGTQVRAESLGLWRPYLHELGLRRLRERSRVDAAADVTALIELAAHTDAHRLEFAIEALAHKGPAAAVALPSLAAVLDRPDPRALGGKQSVPLRAQAARAILRIAPDDALAPRARAVLAGLEPETETPQPPTGSLQRRMDVLMAAMRSAEQREVARQHLAALGAAAAPALLAELASNDDPGFARAAVAVLRDLGPHLGGCLPTIFGLLDKVPGENAAALFDTLAAAAPFARDVLLPGSLPRVHAAAHDAPGRLRGRIAVPADAALDAGAARARLCVSLELPPWTPVGDLVETLACGDHVRVERALRLLLQHGPAARSALPAVASVLHKQHTATNQVTTLSGEIAEVTIYDAGDEIHRLARAAIAAIAPEQAAMSRR